MLSEALLLQFDRDVSVEISYVGYAVTLFSRKRTAPHVDRIAMRDAAVGHAAELSSEVAPLYGFGCEKAVVLAFDHAHDEVGEPEEHIASDLFAGECIALIIDVGIIGISEVELAGRGRPEALDRIIGMRIAVTEDLKPNIRHESGDGPEASICGYFRPIVPCLSSDSRFSNNSVRKWDVVSVRS